MRRWCLALGLLLGASPAFAQGLPAGTVYVLAPPKGATAPIPVDLTGWIFTLAMPPNGLAIGVRDATGTMQPLQTDAAGPGANLNVNCKVGCGPLQTGPKGTTGGGAPTSTSINANATGLDVNIVGGAAAGGTSSTFGAAMPASGTADGARDTGGNMQPLQLDGAGTGQNLNVNCKVGCSSGPTNVTQFGTANVVTGPGASGAGIPRVTVSNDSNVLATQSGTWTVTTAPPSNASENVAQFGGNAVVTGLGSSGLGVPRFTLSTDSTVNLTGWLFTLATPPTGIPIGVRDSKGNLQPLQLDGPGAANLNVNCKVGCGTTTVQGRGTASVPTTPVVCDNWKPFSLASTTALNIIPKSAGKRTYICSINIVSAAANNVALIAGTLATNPCDTSTAGLAGGTTAATGWNFAANGGLAQGTGVGVIAATATAGLDVCLLASGTGQVSGVVSWAQF